MAYKGIEVARLELEVNKLKRRVALLEEMVSVLMHSIQYAVNRLDSEKKQPQIAADLAVNLAYVRGQLEKV